MRIFSSIFEQMMDLLFPKHCIACQKIGTFLCITCLVSVPQANTPADPFITALFDYKHPTIRNGIWKLKYKNIRKLSEPFGAVLYEHILADLVENLDISRSERILIVPIPLHPSRLRERGYNQSELLSRAIIANDSSDLFELSADALSRVHATRPQAKNVARAARFKNLQNAFCANRAVVKNRRIILIDDVATTGATLSGARKVLRAAGARSVSAYTIAH